MNLNIKYFALFLRQGLIKSRLVSYCVSKDDLLFIFEQEFFM